MSRLFGTDGIRGISPSELSPSLAMKTAQALGTLLCQEGKRATVIIGHDTRISSHMLSCAMISGLCSVGVQSQYIGTAPTPAVAYLTRKHRADAGIVISASHNPFEYNGIKIFTSDGYKLPDELEERIEALVCSDIPPASSKNVGICVDKKELLSEYLDYLRAICPESLDSLKIAIDCSNGAWSYHAKELFSSLGASCYMLNCSPNGFNINDSCGATSVGALQRFVSEHSLDAGIAFDGDADRLIAVDEHACAVDGDMIMASLAYDMKKRGALVKSTVVGTVMTNFGFSAFCDENDIRFIPAKVGDRYVLEEMLLGGYCFGGEQSGHLIFGEYSTTGDGALSAIMLLSLMKRKSLPLSTLHSVMHKYPQILINIEADENQKLRFLTSDKIKTALEEAKELLSTNGRLLVRPSGTEKLIRVMVEHKSEHLAEQIAHSVCEKIRKEL